MRNEKEEIGESGEIREIKRRKGKTGEIEPANNHILNTNRELRTRIIEGVSEGNLKTSWRDRVEEAIQRDNGRGREYEKGPRRRNTSEERERRSASPQRRSYVRWNIPDKRKRQGQGSRPERKYGYQYEEDEERDDRRRRFNRASPIRYPTQERTYSPKPPLFRNRRNRMSEHAVNELTDKPSRKDIWEKRMEMASSRCLRQ
ncbi:hypothetical protein Avbf_09454 [Armadillidium vulgare]|nr:hypothetical protein Avbf_09454 [Armadillidium vulgare]